MRFLIFFMLAPFALGAQSFDRGISNFGLHYGLSIYDTKSENRDSHEKNTDHASTQQFGFHYGYGLLPWLSAGLTFNFAKYILDQDSVTNGEQPRVHSVDFYPFAEAHFLRKNNTDISVLGAFGLSSFSYSTGLNELSGDGMTYEGKLHARFYLFASHISLNLFFGYGGYYYSKLTDAYNSAIKFSENGWRFGAGLGWRFGEAKTRAKSGDE
jgi:hypothetical protein